MLKCHHITAFMKMQANFKKKISIGFFWFNYIFPIKFKIRVLDLMLLPKNSVPFEGQYYSSHVCLTCTYKLFLKEVEFGIMTIS